ncbi:hypothetical protein FH972_023511 [Carpinus fangiana]|uniref:Uncharacterized protein n=1 Tax=Carpinus fangiana TaxID=176857 RepID=A0A5N6KVD3_9ROSI|nr:hypothetical protein FH972_023511 [Carpinus fangiana]
MSDPSYAFLKATEGETYISLSFFEGGSFTLMDNMFIFPAHPTASRRCPSLSFLLTHPTGGKPPFHCSPSPGSKKQNSFRTFFDLGHRSQTTKLIPALQPLVAKNGVQAPEPRPRTLQRHGLSASDINLIMLSHVHWDHHGDPEDFPSSRFIVGAGALKVLEEGLGGIAAHQHFDPELLPADRSTELPSTTEREWKALGPFPHALDLFGDGSCYAIDTPGHLPGHTNLLCRVGPGRWKYLGGDVCHDRRLLTGEKEIGTWLNDNGKVCCIHLDKKVAEDSIARLQELEKKSSGIDGVNVEVILAHDKQWYREHAENQFPSNLT